MTNPITNTIESVSQDPGLVSLVLLAQLYGVAADAASLAHEFALDGHRASENQLLRMARHLGFKCKIVTHPLERLRFASLPTLALDDAGAHFIILQANDRQVLIHDCASQQPQTLSTEQFAQRYSGRMLALTLRTGTTDSWRRFDFTWFIPSIIKYRKLFAEVLVISFILQGIALVLPLFFQVITDKVLVHRSFLTLDVLVTALLVVSLFEVILSGLRSYLLSHTTNRIDVELGSRLFCHLLALPLAYFEARRVGDTVVRVKELENIRQFLTGQAMTSVLDLVFSFVFLSVMWFYSGWLTLIILLSLPCYALWSMMISPVLRRRLDEKFARAADNHAFLVESVSAIGTIKSMAVEPQMTRRWDQQLAACVTADFSVIRLANIGQHGIQLIQKIGMVLTLWFGARLVIGGQLSIGQLIAFNMLASQVVAPVVRLSQLWQDFQQVGIAVARLGDILNCRNERLPSHADLPPITGQIIFDRVVFRYRPDGPEVLRTLDLQIAAGEVLGIVGRSGSGKSTLAKLVQRLYVPERGRVLIDGIDLSLADPAWLRRQIGVVAQENLLFNRSIRDNIALADPGVPLARVIEAAQLAGAHAFILDLPHAYDTLVGEHGATLSGGQRQRIAIARALLGEPRILIFDEATSALDYESEQAIMHNMQAICHNRTVLIIAHRLSTVRHCTRLIVMEQGQIIEMGSHDALRQKPGGHYAHLLQLQQG